MGIWSSSILGRLTVLLVTALAVTTSPYETAHAQAGKASLRGTVSSPETGSALPGAVVSVEELNRRTRANQSGAFFISSLPAGTYTVRVRLLGHAVYSTSVELREGSEATLHISLDRLAHRLAPIEVVRARTEMARTAELIPGSVHVVTADEFETENLLHDDVHALLRQVPGVNIQEEEGFGLRPNIGLRGSGTDRSSKVTVMEDGVLIAPAPYAAPSAYHFPVVGRMSAIEVRKGSSQIQYGPRTVGGAINLISTPIPDDLSLSADLVGGEDATRKLRASLGDSYRNVGWLIESLQRVSDGFKRLDGGDRTGYSIQDYNGKIRFNTNPSASVFQSIELKLGYHDERSDETYLGLTDADFAIDPDRRYAASQNDVMTAEHSQYQARYFVRPSRSIDFTATAYRNDFERNWYKLQSVLGQSINRGLDDPQDFPTELAVLRGATSDPDALAIRANNRKYFGQGVQGVFGLQGEAGTMYHQVQIGVRYHEDQEDRFQHEDNFQMVGGTMVLTTAGAPGSQSNRVSDAKALAFFVHDQIGVGNFTFTPGLRYEMINFKRTDYAADDPNRTASDRVRESTVSAVIPGVGVSYEFHPGVSLFGGVHRGFAPPGPGSNDSTEAERSINYEIGARYNVGPVNAQAVGFFSDYNNILGTSTLATGDEGSGDQFNGGAVNVFGVELSADVDPLRSRGLPVSLPIIVAFTYTSTEFETAFESDFDPWGTVEEGDELPYLPEVQVSGSVGIAALGAHVNLTAQYQSEMRTVAGQGEAPTSETTDSYFILGASGEYYFGPGISLFAGVRNLLNERYIVARRPAGTRPGLPRTFLAGVKVRR